jgi:hypothetical protein
MRSIRLGRGPGITFVWGGWWWVRLSPRTRPYSAFPAEAGTQGSQPRWTRKRELRTTWAPAFAAEAEED